MVELETLRQIEIALGGNLPIQAFFDLMVGTRFVLVSCHRAPFRVLLTTIGNSTGGIVALGLGAMGWSVETCIDRFRDLCAKAFTRRKGGIVVESFHHSKYQTTTLESALQEAFPDKRLLFGGGCKASTSIPMVKVAVTSFSVVENKTAVLSNYNRPWTAGEKG